MKTRATARSKPLLAAPVALLSLLATACASVATDSGSAATGAEDESKEESREIEALERKIEIARARLEVARLEQKAAEEALEVRLRHAATELELAEATLARFVEVDAPTRLAEERLDLRSARDRAQEAADELAQIEIMYEDQDLDDLTAEFVVSRGRRNAERAAARIEIQEGRLRSLEERELPQEEKRLRLAVDRAQADLREAERSGEIGRHGKAIAVREAENEIERLEEELVEKREEAQS